MDAELAAFPNQALMDQILRAGLGGLSTRAAAQRVRYFNIVLESLGAISSNPALGHELAAARAQMQREYVSLLLAASLDGDGGLSPDQVLEAAAVVGFHSASERALCRQLDHLAVLVAGHPPSGLRSEGRDPRVAPSGLVELEAAVARVRGALAQPRIRASISEFAQERLLPIDRHLAVVAREQRMTLRMQELLHESASCQDMAMGQTRPPSSLATTPLEACVPPSGGNQSLRAQSYLQRIRAKAGFGSTSIPLGVPASPRLHRWTITREPASPSDLGGGRHRLRLEANQPSCLELTRRARLRLDVIVLEARPPVPLLGHVERLLQRAALELGPSSKPDVQVQVLARFGSWPEEVRLLVEDHAVHKRFFHPRLSLILVDLDHGEIHLNPRDEQAVALQPLVSPELVDETAQRARPIVAARFQGNTYYPVAELADVLGVATEQAAAACQLLASQDLGCLRQVPGIGWVLLRAPSTPSQGAGSQICEGT